MPVDRSNIEIGTPGQVRKLLMAIPLSDRPAAQQVAKEAVKLERKRIMDGFKKLLGK